jgi:hypothetical protein
MKGTGTSTHAGPGIGPDVGSDATTDTTTDTTTGVDAAAGPGAGKAERRRGLRALLARRRVYAAVPILAVTLAAQYKTAHPAPVFRAVAVVALQAPIRESVEDDKPNPYTDPRRSLAATAAVVSQGMKSSSEAAVLHASGVVGAYDLEPRNSGTTEEPYFSMPRMDVTADAGDPDTAVKSVDVLVSKLDSELVALQNRVGVDPSDRITSLLLAKPSAAPVLGSRTRALLAVSVLGFGAAYLVPRWWDSAASRRAGRRDAARGASRVPASRGVPRRRSAPGTR